MTKKVTCPPEPVFARAVESAVFASLLNAERDPQRADYWRAHADKLESKFTTDYGRHYSYFTGVKK